MDDHNSSTNTSELEEKEIEINNIIKVIENQFMHVLSHDMFEVSYDRKHLNYILRYRTLTGFAKDENTCFDIEFRNKIMFIENLKYPCETKCLLSGPTILINLYFIAKTLHYSTIMLSDESRLLIDKKQISLRIYHTLLYGYSWYNKFKFNEIEYQSEDRKLTDKLRQSTLFDIYEKCYSELDQKIFLDNMSLIPELQFETSVTDFMMNLNTHLRSDSHLKVNCLQLFDEIANRLHLYEGTSYLSVTDKDTIEFYDAEFKKLIKKIKRTHLINEKDTQVETSSIVIGEKDTQRNTLESAISSIYNYTFTKKRKVDNYNTNNTITINKTRKK